MGRKKVVRESAKEDFKNKEIVLVLGSCYIGDRVLEKICQAMGITFLSIENFKGIEEGKKFIGVQTHASNARCIPDSQPKWEKTENSTLVLFDNLYFFFDRELELISEELKLHVPLSLGENDFLRKEIDRIAVNLPFIEPLKMK